jgi:integrase
MANDKRTYGTGSLQVVRGSWIGSWYGPDRRRVKRVLGPVRTPGSRAGLTKAQAERALRRIREQEHELVATRRVTMREAGDEFLLRLELKGRKKSWLLTAASDIRIHLVPFYGGKELARITPEDVERYILTKRKTHSIKTVRNHVNLTHSIFELGLRKQWCLSNPVKRADRPQIRSNETRIRFLYPVELEQLLASDFLPDAFGKVERVLYLTAAMTGLRQGELVALRWRDVDLEARRVRVVSSYVRGEFGDPKSATSSRSVPLAARVADELRLWRWGSMYAHDDDLVFAHPEMGGPLDRAKLIRRFKQSLERAGVRRITFHELRHTFGTRMAATGVPLRTIQHWMGHSDTKTTQIYAHYQPAPYEAEFVDQAFGPLTAATARSAADGLRPGIGELTSGVLGDNTPAPEPEHVTWMNPRSSSRTMDG